MKALHDAWCSMRSLFHDLQCRLPRLVCRRELLHLSLQLIELVDVGANMIPFSKCPHLNSVIPVELSAPILTA